MKYSPSSCNCRGTGYENSALAIYCRKCQGAEANMESSSFYFESLKSPELRSSERIEKKLDKLLEIVEKLS